MSRYIDANKLVAHLEDEIVRCNPPFGSRSYNKSIAYGTTLGLRSAIAFANTLSTADVVEVCRCKDCAYCRYVDGADIYKCDRRWYYSEEVKPTDYCSYGERRKE